MWQNGIRHLNIWLPSIRQFKLLYIHRNLINKKSCFHLRYFKKKVSSCLFMWEKWKVRASSPLKILLLEGHNISSVDISGASTLSSCIVETRCQWTLFERATTVPHKSLSSTSIIDDLVWLAINGELNFMPKPYMLRGWHVRNWPYAIKNVVTNQAKSTWTSLRSSSFWSSSLLYVSPWALKSFYSPITTEWIT